MGIPMRLKDLKCVSCNNDELFAVKPGGNGKPQEFFCYSCWWQRWGWDDDATKLVRKRRSAMPTTRLPAGK